MSRLSEDVIRSLIGNDLLPILRSSTGGYRPAARQHETGQDERQQPEDEEPLQEPLREPTHRHLQSGDSGSRLGSRPGRLWRWGKIWSIVRSPSLTRLYGPLRSVDVPDSGRTVTGLGRLRAWTLAPQVRASRSMDITEAPLPPRRPRSWRGKRETHRRRGPVEQEDYPQPSRTSGESALLLRRSMAGRSRSRDPTIFHDIL